MRDRKFTLNQTVFLNETVYVSIKFYASEQYVEHLEAKKGDFEKRFSEGILVYLFLYFCDFVFFFWLMMSVVFCTDLLDFGDQYRPLLFIILCVGYFHLSCVRVDNFVVYPFWSSYNYKGLQRQVHLKQQKKSHKDFSISILTANKC